MKDFLTTLTESQTNWPNPDGYVDWDGASHDLAKVLGVIEQDARFLDYKGVYWTDNKIGNGLHNILIELVKMGILDDEDGNAHFKVRPDRESVWD